MPRTTISPVVASRSAMKVGSASSSLCSSGPSLASSPRFLGMTAKRHLGHGRADRHERPGRRSRRGPCRRSGCRRSWRRRRGRRPRPARRRCMSLPWISSRSPMRSVVPGARDGELRLARERAAPDAQVGELADVGIDLDLPDLGGERAGGIHHHRRCRRRRRPCGRPARRASGSRARGRSAACADRRPSRRRRGGPARCCRPAGPAGTRARAPPG